MAVINTHSTDLESGSSQYWSNSSKTGIPTGNNNRSFEAWVKMESHTSTITVLAYGTRANYQSWTWLINTSGVQVVDIFNEASAASSTALTDGVWTHIAITWNGTTLTFYKDGVADGTDTFANTVNTGTTTDFFIGINNDASGIPFDGLIDDVRVWNDIRTQSEIDDNKDNCNLSVSEAGLVSWWAFNNNGTDENANGNNLTNNNSATFTTDLPYSCAAAAFIPSITII